MYRDHSPVEQKILRTILNTMLDKLGLDNRVFCFHGLRAGHATDLFNWGVPLEEIKMIGRWKSNAVYKYLKLT